MKKSLVALAVLAASGAAMAQSTVTLYGIMDTMLLNAKYDTGTGVALNAGNNRRVANAGVNGTTQNLVIGGGVNGSRWGMKGTEDLGGGLSAVFDLEAGIGSDDGTFASATAFHREASVGLKGSFGTVRVGRLNNIYYEQEGNFTGGFNGSGLSAETIAMRGASGGDLSFERGNFSSRFDNSFRWDSANMSGFTASAQIGLTENKTTTVDAGLNTAAIVAYNNGPIGVQVVYQSSKTTDVAVATTNLRVGGAYDFGAAKVGLNYGKAGGLSNGTITVDGAEATEYEFNVTIPVNAQVNVNLAYATSKDNAIADPLEGKRTAYSIMGSYRFAPVAKPPYTHVRGEKR